MQLFRPFHAHHKLISEGKLQADLVGKQNSRILGFSNKFLMIYHGRRKGFYCLHSLARMGACNSTGCGCEKSEHPGHVIHMSFTKANTALVKCTQMANNTVLVFTHVHCAYMNMIVC